MLSTISPSKGISWRGGTSRVDSRERITARRLRGALGGEDLEHLPAAGGHLVEVDECGEHRMLLQHAVAG